MAISVRTLRASVCISTMLIIAPALAGCADISIAEETSGAAEEEAPAATAEQPLYEDGCSGKVALVAAGVLLDPAFIGAIRLFNGACVVHDYCYMGGLATYGKSKSNCDSDFRAAMENRCRSVYKNWWESIQRAHCIGVARTMYEAVSNFGGKYFKSNLCTQGEVYTSSNHDSLNCSAWEPYAGTPTVAPVSCSGTPGQWNGCRGSGCAACTDLLGAYPRYFVNNPYCVPNSTCGSVHAQCNTACPAPTDRDR